MKKRLLALLLAAVIAVMPVCVSATDVSELPEEYTVVDAIKEYIKANYQFDIDFEEVLDSVIIEVLRENPELYDEIARGMMNGLDDYSVYYSSEEFKEFFTQIEAAYAGIGAYISRINGYATVSGFVENSPAEKAGMMQGDIILAVNGEDVAGKDTEIVVGKIRGDEGTNVTITVKRGEETLDITIVRATLHTATITSQILEGNVGYIAISQFSSSTASEFKTTFLKMKEQGVDRFIIDVRNNPGGVTSQAVGCASVLLPKGTTVLKVNSKSMGESVYTSNYLAGKKEKVVVLTNEYSASAAEIFAVAIKDNDAGILVGTKTYGKGTMQTTASLGEYGGLKVTMAEFVGPAGTPINNVGVAPHEVVINVESFAEQSDFTPLKFEKKFYLGDDDEQIYALKERLRVMGYFNGTMDNYFDDVLDAAVKQFQSDVGLFPCGDLDFSTQTAINNLVTEYKVVRDSQFDRAYEIVKGM